MNNSSPNPPRSSSPVPVTPPPPPRRASDFTTLECWKAARDLRTFVARSVIPKLPNAERFRLADQITRAARSVPANIAEGYGRYHYLDSIKFFSNARGSCEETIEHLIAAADEQFISPELLAEGIRYADSTRKLLNGYVRYLRSKAAGRSKGDEGRGLVNEQNHRPVPE